MTLQEQILRIKQVMGISIEKSLPTINEYSEQQPELKSSNVNNFIFIDSISQVPKVGVPMNKEKFKKDGESALSWDNIVAVRATDELPSINKGYMVMHTSKALKTMGWSDDFMRNLKQKWEKNYKDWKSWDVYVKEYIDAIGNRWTKHFTLNHLVDDNMGGSWSDLSFIYLMPGKELVRMNGAPSNTYAIDTWFSKSVVVPKNTVVLYTPNAKSRIEKMSLQFSSDLEGKQLKYPVYFLEISSRESVNEVIDSMGYSTIIGGNHYSTEAGVDDEIMDFTSNEEIPVYGIHSETFWSRLEQGRVDFLNLFFNLDHLIQSTKNTKKIDEFYDKHRRIMKSYIDKIFEKQIELYERKKSFDSLLSTLEIIKNNIGKYDMIKNFRKDINNSITKNNVLEVLKNYLWKENGYNSFEDFLNEYLPK